MEIAIVEIIVSKINVHRNAELYWKPIVRIVKSTVPATKAILGLVKIDSMKIYAGIGSMYGEVPDGISIAITTRSVEREAETERYLGSRNSFSKNFIYER